jgi:CheY-like chemotaxis protein
MRRLLLVEDAPDIVLIVQRLSRRVGQEVLPCANVATAWSCLQLQSVDLVILDLNLPGERGEVLCRRLRASASLARQPVALFADLDRPKDIISGLEAGADYLVVKDLLCSPEAWSARLHELVPPGSGRPVFCALGCQPARIPPEGWSIIIDHLNRGLRHSFLRLLGPEVARYVVRRALLAAVAGRGFLLVQDVNSGRDALENWFEPDGLGLDAGAILKGSQATAVPAFGCALGIQLWCLVGTRFAAPLLEELAAVVAGPAS